MKRLLAVLAGLCIAASPMVVVPANPAQAAGVNVLCTGLAANLDFVPGLTNTQQTVQVFYTTSLACPIPGVGINGGTGTGSFTITGATCTNLTFSAHTITYNFTPTSRTSVVNFSAVTVNLLTIGSLLQTGAVSSGYRAGDIAEDTITPLNLNLAACNTSGGLTRLSGPEELVFLSLT
jgi:hypothetical protein